MRKFLAFLICVFFVASNAIASNYPSTDDPSTGAKQDTGNSSLSSIDSKTPALGQALAAGSVPVVLTAAQISTLTPVSTVTANAGTNLNTSALALESGGNLAASATSLGVLDNAISGSEMQVDVITMPSVTIGTFPDNEPFNLAQVNGTTTPVATNGTNTTGAGVQQVGPLFQADDAATGACTENQFCPPRINATRRSVIVEGVASGTAIPVSAASGTYASGSIASGAIASGAIASGAIAAGAIAAGATSVADNEDVASANADRLVKVAQIRLDTPVSGANLSGSGDYTQFIADSFGKTWTAGTFPEDTAHIASEPIVGAGALRDDTLNARSGTEDDWEPLHTTADGALWASLAPTTTSGLSVMNATSSDGGTALTSTAQVIKATAGNLYGYYIYNPNSTAQYVQFYNTAAASVTVGTTNPLFMLTIPATSGANLMFPYPVTFSNAGWSWAATSTAGGNGAPTTALEAVAWYK